MIEFACPSCGKHLRTEDRHAGRASKCPKCQAAVAVPLPPTWPSEPEQPTPPAADPPPPEPEEAATPISKRPTKRQLDFAQDLGIEVEPTATRTELTKLISAAIEERDEAAAAALEALEQARDRPLKEWTAKEMAEALWEQGRGCAILHWVDGEEEDGCSIAFPDDLEFEDVREVITNTAMVWLKQDHPELFGK